MTEERITYYTPKPCDLCQTGTMHPRLTAWICNNCEATESFDPGDPVDDLLAEFEGHIEASLKAARRSIETLEKIRAEIRRRTEDA